MKQLLITLMLFCATAIGQSQVKWKEDIPKGQEFSFENYSTTYLGDIDTKKPILVAAIPYNGSYNTFEQTNAPLDLTFTGSLYSYKSTLNNKGQHLFTDDSGFVYFLAFNIDKKSMSRYDFRIILDGDKIIKPWTGITEFTDLSLNNFEKAAQLGGYQTNWGHYLTAELRDKKADTLVAITQVSWKEAKPMVSGVFHSKNLHQFFTHLKRPWENIKGTSTDSLVFEYPENSLIFNLHAEIFKKEALEYQLSKDGTIIRPWSTNEYDDGFIWLKTLQPGKYRLDIRFSKQRHNPNSYLFEIKPQFHQTSLFKIISGSLIAAFFGFLIFFFRSRKQTQRLRQSEQEKEKLSLNIRAVRSQLNPHFIFNALGSIQSLVNKNQNDNANEYLVSFSSLLRQTLQLNEKEFIPAREEARMLEKYLYLEQLRFPFEYTVELEPGCENMELPSFLTQPLVENAVKHGLLGNKESSLISIKFFRNQDKLIVIIEDNGQGFNPDTVQEGHGLKLVKQRIKLLNETNSGKSISLLTESSVNTGTKVTISIHQ